MSCLTAQVRSISHFDTLQVVGTGTDLGLGSRLGVTFLNYYPTIYSISDPEPLAICTGRNRPDGTPVGDSERTYINACTMKVRARCNSKRA